MFVHEHNANGIGAARRAGARGVHGGLQRGALPHPRVLVEVQQQRSALAVCGKLRRIWLRVDDANCATTGVAAGNALIPPLMR